MNVNYENWICLPALGIARILNLNKAFLRHLRTPSESPVARPIHALCLGDKQTHKVYIHIYKHRDANKKM